MSWEYRGRISEWEMKGSVVDLGERVYWCEWEALDAVMGLRSWAWVCVYIYMYTVDVRDQSDCFNMTTDRVGIIQKS